MLAASSRAWSSVRTRLSAAVASKSPSRAQPPISTDVEWLAMLSRVVPPYAAPAQMPFASRESRSRMNPLKLPPRERIEEPNAAAVVPPSVSHGERSLVRHAAASEACAAERLSPVWVTAAESSVASSGLPSRQLAPNTPAASRASRPVCWTCAAPASNRTSRADCASAACHATNTTHAAARAVISWPYGLTGDVHWHQTRQAVGVGVTGCHFRACRALPLG